MVMAAVDNAGGKRILKFKITCKGVKGVSEEKSHENVVKTMNVECRDGVIADRNTNSVSDNTKKRKPGMILECQNEKRQRMDRIFKSQCVRILEALMTHRYGHIFNEPVDPVKLNLPDYSSIITHPMDLGTIQHKLEDNVYLDVKEFAADVKLTFKNAMRYNPPGHFVHKLAKELNDAFSRKWKLLEPKLKYTGRNPQQLSKFNEIEMNGQVIDVIKEEQGQKAKQNCLSKASLHNGMATERRAKPVKTAEVGQPKSVKSIHKDNSGQSAGAIARKPAFDSLTVECAACDSLICQCSDRRSSVKPSFSDFSSKRSSGRNNLGDGSKPDRGIEYPVTSHTGGLKSDNDGHVISVNSAESFWHGIASNATALPSDEGLNSLGDVYMSPNKALRAAMLKRRFADTIFKATHQSLLWNRDEKIDPVTMQKERERLERQQCQEKARIGVEIRVAEEAQRRAKMCREREREAARIALEKMEQTVYIYNLDILEDVEAIVRSMKGGNFRNPVEQLGLFLKKMEEDEDQNQDQDAEEGEIL